jgi:hypothetical protein
VRYVVGVKDESKYFADPSVDYEIVPTNCLSEYVAISSFQHDIFPSSSWYRDSHLLKMLDKLPRWAVSNLKKLQLIKKRPGCADIFMPTTDFVLCKARSARWNLEDARKSLTTALVEFEPRHNCIVINWMPGSLLRRTWRFGYGDAQKAINLAKGLIELSKNIINTHEDITRLAAEYGKKTKPLYRWRSWADKESYPLLPSGDSL